MTDAYPRTGPEAIEHALARINLDELEAEQRKVIRDKKKTARPRAVRILGILAGLRKNQVEAKDLMLKSVPVIPPQFRPFSVAGDTFLPGDANEHYRDLLEYRRLYQKTEEAMGRAGSGDVYGDLVKAVNATYGYGDSPNPKTKARGVKGFFQQISGTSPKTGYVQSKLLSKPVDTTSRGVIIPDADYDMNEVGVPVEKGWKLYSSYVQSRLVRSGMQPPAALRHVRDRTPEALKALESEMKVRPVVLTRSPAWHRFSVVGSNPRLIEGDAIRINTWITDGMTADFDGDDHKNQVVMTIDSDLQLNKSWTDLGIYNTDNPMFKQLNLPMLGANKRVVITDLEDFPKTEHIFSKEGANGPIHFYGVPAGTQVVALDEVTGKPLWADVSCFSEHPGRVVEIVNLTNRKQIITDHDPRAVYGVSPSDPEMRFLRFTPTDALTCRVCVPVVKHTAPLEDPANVAVTVAGKSIPLSVDFGFLLGALCGDGWWDKRDHDYYRERGMFDDTRAVNLSDLKGHVAQRCEATLRALFQLDKLYVYAQTFLRENNADRYGDTVKYTYGFAGSGGLAVWLADHLGGERCDKSTGSANKRIPGFAYTAPREFREGLLAGLLDTDGTCSVSHGKGKPQLMISFGSTSLRLARECAAICRTLGIAAVVSFSKETSGGNTAWNVTISTVDAKREGFLGRLLQTPYKRDNFNNTHVCDVAGSEVREATIIPRHIWEYLTLWSLNPKIRSSERTDRSPEMLRKRHQQNLAAQLHRSGKSGIASRRLIDMVEVDIRKRRGEATLALALGIGALEESLVDGKFTQVRSELVREAVRSLAPKQCPRYGEGCKVAARINGPLRDGVMPTKTTRGLLAWLRDTPRVADPLEAESYVAWRKRFVDTDLDWAVVESVEYTGQKEDGYDLTVPGYETFMSADGVILSNTMSVHVPSSDAAVKDVRERLMPDKMLWSIKNRDKVVPVPKHEQILGISMGGNLPIKNKLTYRSNEEAMEAINNGQIDLNDDITIDAAYTPAQTSPVPIQEPPLTAQAPLTP